MSILLDEGAEPLQVFAKAPDPDLELFGDAKAASASAVIAGGLGIGPQIIAHDDRGLIVAEALTDGWRVASLADLALPEISLAVLRARQRLHAGPRFPLSRTVFEHIEVLLDRLRTAGGHEPEDLAWLLQNVGEIASAISASGYDRVPAHNDGTASNILIAEGHHRSVRLTDFDLAANTDPFEDLGSHLVEAHCFERDARQVFERLVGKPDERGFSRAWLYGIADDLRWGLIGLLLSKCSTRIHLEFMKYAEWRLLRCRLSIRDPHFEEKLRLL